jgi:hypothetical protein
MSETTWQAAVATRNEVHFAHITANKGHVAGVMGGCTKDKQRRDRKHGRRACREEERFR